ncbi:transcription antitermination factor NusB [Pseudoruegeria sp. SK021]|uniref:transcription antitermination factor NusB n=1 Tax=Pseudoruegeria sp. SK021 TaxID=1933035 RepID=UPI000A23B867|nr:transcription antitermination factor NusB [Pseudoruegeria sp. SK021]OSP56219.1 transcription antitermination factor NusB [Pseudoruegeria sp. SK021]
MTDTPTNSDSNPDDDQPLPLSGNQKRKLKSAARFFAVQALFQMETTQQTAETVVQEFSDHRFGERFDDHEMVEADKEFFRSLIDGAVNWQAQIDQITHRALVAKWPIARIDPTLRALFRAAGAELVRENTPPRVVITEYMAVSDAFFPDGKEAKFVNAVLDHMAHEASPDGF